MSQAPQEVAQFQLVVNNLRMALGMMKAPEKVLLSCDKFITDLAEWKGVNINGEKTATDAGTPGLSEKGPSAG